MICTIECPTEPFKFSRTLRRASECKHIQFTMFVCIGHLLCIFSLRAKDILEGIIPVEDAKSNRMGLLISYDKYKQQTVADEHFCLQ